MTKRYDSDDDAELAGSGGQRLDKWLWFVRIVKSRTAASELVRDGAVRINREKASKPSQWLKAGDVVTVVAHRQVRVLKVLAPGERRGPASEARLLFEDLTPQSERRPDQPSSPDGPAAREPGTGRPTKRERRDIDRLKGR